MAEGHLYTLQWKQWESNFFLGEAQRTRSFCMVFHNVPGDGRDRGQQCIKAKAERNFSCRCQAVHLKIRPFLQMALNAREITLHNLKRQKLKCLKLGHCCSGARDNLHRGLCSWADVFGVGVDQIATRHKKVQFKEKWNRNFYDIFFKAQIHEANPYHKGIFSLSLCERFTQLNLVIFNWNQKKPSSFIAPNQPINYT